MGDQHSRQMGTDDYSLFTDPEDQRNRTASMSLKSDDEVEEKEDPKASWSSMSWLLLSDVVGSSVLTFSGVTASLGWVMGISSMVVFCYLGYYCAVLMSRARTMIEESTGTSPGSMGETSRALLGDRAASWTYLIVYGIFAFLGNASYLLVLGDSLKDIFLYWDVTLCAMTASCFACLFVLPMAALTRQLRSVSTICFFNLFLILGLLAICLIQIANNGRSATTTTDLVNPNLTLLSFSQAMANTMYSYAGHWMYFEIMSEMETPVDFPKVFYINAPLQLGIYMTVAVTGYHYLGSEGEHYLIDNMEQGSTARVVVQMLLFVHISISFLIKNVALCRFVVDRIDASALARKDTSSRLLFAAVSSAIIALGWVVANAMPVFYDLLGLIGALLCGPISFVFPIGFFVLAKMLWTSETDRLCTPKGEPQADDDNHGSYGGAASLGEVGRWVASHMPPYQISWMSAIVMFVGLIMVTGSISSIKDINSKVQAGEASVFSC